MEGVIDHRNLSLLHLHELENWGLPLVKGWRSLFHKVKMTYIFKKLGLVCFPGLQTDCRSVITGEGELEFRMYD